MEIQKGSETEKGWVGDKGWKVQTAHKGLNKGGVGKLQEAKRGGWKGNRDQKIVEGKKGWEAEKRWEAGGK